MSDAETVHINSGSILLRPTPRGAGVIKVNMRRQKTTDVRWLETEFPDPFDHGIEYGFRPAVDEK